MPGVVQHSPESLRKAATEAVAAGLAGVMLFGVPEHKDARGSQALADDGILNLAIADVRAEVGDDLLVMSDVCLDEFTDHGHCGVLTADGAVDNDATVEIYAEMAVAHAAAGAHVVAPSGMMDGQVGAIRYGARRRRSPGHRDPGLRGEVRVGLLRPVPGGGRVLAAGRSADLPAGSGQPAGGAAGGPARCRRGRRPVMVKPALGYLDVLADVRAAVDIPVAAYNVSGEYAMVEAAAAQGWINREAAIAETLTSIRRAGADVILTYWALEYARRRSSSS